MEQQSCHGSIPILESSVTVCRDIPAVLVGKMHWIDWSVLCDRLDEALKPLRKLKSPSSSKRMVMPTFRRKSCVRSKALKNLQKVCDKEVQRHDALRDFVLYCPSNSGDRLAVTNWHIQVVVHANDHVPTNISVPMAMAVSDVIYESRSAPFGLPFWPEPDNPPFELLVPPAHHQRFTQARQRQQLRHSTAASMTSSFSSLASGELDRILDGELWMSAPSLGGNYHQDTLPIPMPPPAPRAKILEA